MVGGGKGAFFAWIRRAAMLLGNRFEISAGNFSSDPDRSRLAGEALGLAPESVYPTYEELIAGERDHEQRVDVALILTPNHPRYAPCRKFLEAGFPVICEKPLVNEMAQARELVRLCKSTGLLVGVTYTYQGFPIVKGAPARVRDGEIGEVRFVYGEYLLDWLAGDRTKLGEGGKWRGDLAIVGNTAALGDVGTHAFTCSNSCPA